jgi:hypothetical protein
MMSKAKANCSFSSGTIPLIFRMTSEHFHRSRILFFLTYLSKLGYRIMITSFAAFFTRKVTLVKIVPRALLAVRSQFGLLNEDARFHVISHLIRESVNCGKSLLATSIVGRDDNSDLGSFSKETGWIHNLIQKDRVLAAVSLKAVLVLSYSWIHQLVFFEYHTQIFADLVLLSDAQGICNSG